MRISYKVASEYGRWSVRQGHTRPLLFNTRQEALRAAENLAKAPPGGDTAVVELVAASVVPQALRFT